MNTENTSENGESRFRRRRVLIPYCVPEILADYVFEPMMQPGGWGVDLFGKLVGTGPGAGMGLMMVLAGAVAVILGLSGFIIPSIRNLEKLIPDCETEAEPEVAAADTVEAED